MSLPCHISGPASAPPILFLHGGGVSGWMWEPVVDRLSDRFRCLVPDLPGHGRLACERFSFAGAVAALAELIRTAAGGPVHVVGLSLGAQTALHLIASHPHLVGRAVVSGALTRPLPGIGPYRVLLRLTFPLAHREWMIRANARQLGIPREYLAQFRADTLQTTAEGLEAVVAENMAFRLPDALRTAPVPLLALVGGRELGLLTTCARDLARNLPSARAYVVPGAGHTWCLDRPDLFAAVVAAHVADEPVPPELVPLV
ncbi:pimeloyl-ACP methyl ester carboxylesterase [Symbiobacterium terraclitae]|uniref:Pimeloyl-ACP methyl ester carboxylesterase n=1 Tax=Symbiobacterium terraclitae TaxID=557451 RepID=A0ABS4JW12_9FIRM|nr:alpha/beta hydrolase [Symbiobacterium terraclitae]MBP2019737.1 pimeloyl-ACP methyl ester carboxylesterase [Symbiobacterium terraclitae]